MTTTKEITITATSGANTAQISIDGKEIGFGNYSTGINLAVFEETTGKPLFSTNFAPFKYQAYTLIPEAFADLIDTLPEGRIVAVAVKGDPGLATDVAKAKAAFKSIGSSDIDQLPYGGQLIALVGIKGHDPGTAHESISWSETSSSYTLDVEAVKATGGFVVEAISKPSTVAPPYYYPVTGGEAEFLVNGNPISVEGGTKPGWNLVVLDRKTGAVKSTGSYNPGVAAEVDEFVTTIEDLEAGEVVAIATKDYAGGPVEQKVKKACSSIGSTMAEKMTYGGNWVIVGYKGAKPGKAVENFSGYIEPANAPTGVAVKYWELPTEPVPKGLKVGQKLFLSDAGTYFGCGVGIDGDYALVGDYYDKGIAYIYRWHDGKWQIQQQLLPKDHKGQRIDSFGYSVDISGNLAIVGAMSALVSGTYSGAAHIYELKGDQWQQQQMLRPSDLKSDYYFGYSVAIDGKKAIVGAYYAHVPGKKQCGAAYIFHLENGKWVQKAKLQPDDLGAGDQFGDCVSIDDNIAIVGVKYVDAPGKNNCGAAYIFHWENGQWKQQQKLQPPDLGNDDHFGSSVAVAGNLAIVGAYGADVSGKRSAGAAYIYQLQDSIWQLHQKIQATDPNAYDYFGTSVGIGSNVAVVGANCADASGKENCGAAYMFQLVNGKWEQKQKLQPEDFSAQSRWGGGVSFDGQRAIISGGGYYSNPKIGFAYICDVTVE